MSGIRVSRSSPYWEETHAQHKAYLASQIAHDLMTTEQAEEELKNISAYRLNPQQEDFFLWPNGDLCMREEHCEVTSQNSDDYEVIPFDTGRWNELAREHGYN